MAPFIWILGSTLLYFLWQGTLIGLLAAAALRSGVRRSAQWRYVVCMLAIFACVLAPLITGLVLAYQAHEVLPDIAQAAVTPAAETLVFIPEDAGLFGLSPQGALITVAAWLAGVLCLAIRYVVEWQRILRMRLSAAPLLVPPLLADIAAQVLQRWNLSGRVRTAISHMTTTPLVVGWWRPLIIFPAALITRMPPREFELVLLHEIAHILRRDTWMNALQVLVKIALFYHPAVHWLCARARIERECACDDFVISHSGSTYEYARMLVSLAPREVSNSALTVGATTGADLVPRLRYLAGECVEDDRSQNRHAPFALIAVLVICALWAITPRTDGLNFEGATSPLPRLTLDFPQPLGLPPIEPEALALSENWRSGSDTQRSAATALADQLADPEAAAQLPELSISIDRADTQTQTPSPLPLPTDPVRAELPVAAPVLTFKPMPEYPLPARLEGIEGSVDVVLRVGPDGRPNGLRITSAEPIGVFEGATRRALMQWRFEPSSGAETIAAYQLKFSLGGVTTNATTPCATATSSLTCPVLSPR